MTTSPPCGSFSMRGTPADMVGKGVPSVFCFCVLAETNLTGERPFHTRTQEEPVNDTDPPSLHKLAKTQTQYDPVPFGTATTVFNKS